MRSFKKISYALYLFESNSRHTTSLGIVGAGGIGVELLSAMRLADYDQALTILLAVWLMVSMVDYSAGWFRQRVIA